MKAAIPPPRAPALKVRPAAPEILCYGHDPMLLYTRQKILQRLGWVVTLASNMDEYKTSVLRQSTSVVVCCQTLMPEQVLKAVVFAEQSELPVRFLVMFIRVPPIAELWGCLLLASEANPRTFERAVFDLLQQAFFEDPPAS